MLLADKKKRWALLGLSIGIAAYGIVKVRADETLEQDTNIKVCGTVSVFLNPIASRIYRGQAVTLTWSATNIETLESNFGAQGAGGSVRKTLNSVGTFTFTVTAKSTCGTGGTDSMSRSVTVVQPPPPPPPPPPYHRCFVAGTPISMADGTFKNVENVKPGDLVKSFDVATGKYVTSKVTDRYKSEWDSFYQINGSNGVTGPHEFMANGKWTRVDELKVGDKLVNEKGEPVEITSLVKRPGPVDIFPLFVENPPADYFAEGVLVHNRDDDGELHEGEGLVAGTKVLMADGSRKPIELVRKGEGLMSYWPKKRGLGTAKVRETFPGTTAKEYVIINDTLQLGPGHRLIKMNEMKEKPKE